MPRVVPPVTDDDNRFFWEGVADGRLLVQRCVSCGALRHPPGPMCPRCQSLDWDTVEASGRGTVYSYVLSHHPTEPDAEPRLVVLVDLEEGVRLVANLVRVPWPQVHNGMAVEAFFAEVDGVMLPQFRPAPVVPDVT
jgi:uncharacterized OB-fold protein